MAKEISAKEAEERWLQDVLDTAPPIPADVAAEICALSNAA